MAPTLVSVTLAAGATAAGAGTAQQTRAPGGPEAPFTALVPPGVRLAPTFIEHLHRDAENATPDCCFYTDFAVSGRAVEVGDWSIERSRWQDYTGPVLVVPTSALGGAPVSDAVALASARLHCLSLASCVHHVPAALYEADHDSVTQLSPAARRRTLTQLPYRLDESGHRRPHAAPTVSVVIPTRLTRDAGAVLLDRCLDSASAELERWRAQVVIVLDEDTDPGPLRRWQRRWPDRLMVVTTPLPFNFSTKINEGVSVATGQMIVMLNDDVAATDERWLTELIAVAMEPTVGAVAPLLLYGDGSVQHRGHAFSQAGVHLVDSGRSPDDPGPRRRNLSDRDVTGVTAACLVQRREVWSALGGLDPGFPVAFNDVDYCERIRAEGLRVVLCNSVSLTHFESRTRHGSAQQWEVDRLARRWPDSWGRPDPLTPGPPPAVKTRIRQWLDRLRN